MHEIHGSLCENEAGDYFALYVFGNCYTGVSRVGKIRHDSSLESLLLCDPI